MKAEVQTTQLIFEQTSSFNDDVLPEGEIASPCADLTMMASGRLQRHGWFDGSGPIQRGCRGDRGPAQPTTVASHNHQHLFIWPLLRLLSMIGLRDVICDMQRFGQITYRIPDMLEPRMPCMPRMPPMCSFTNPLCPKQQSIHWPHCNG